MSDVSYALKKIRPGFYLGKPAILLRRRTETSLCRSGAKLRIEDFEWVPESIETFHVIITLLIYIFKFNGKDEYSWIKPYVLVIYVRISYVPGRYQYFLLWMQISCQRLLI